MDFLNACALGGLGLELRTAKMGVNKIVTIKRACWADKGWELLSLVQDEADKPLSVGEAKRGGSTALLRVIYVCLCMAFP